MKVFFFLSFLLSSIALAQVDTSTTINGVIQYGNSVYLVSDDGYFIIESSDPYEEYYRKIYNDSTIVNPNTVLGKNLDLKLIPYLNLTNDYKKFIFDQPINIGLFLDFSDSNSPKFSPYTYYLIDSLFVEESKN